MLRCPRELQGMGKKGGLILEAIPEHAYSGLCTPLPYSPLQSPNPPQKICPEMEEAVFNADILKAINCLKDRFSKFKEIVIKTQLRLLQ